MWSYVNDIVQYSAIKKVFSHKYQKKGYIIKTESLVSFQGYCASVDLEVEFVQLNHCDGVSV